MGRCASHCSVPGDHSSPAGFHQVLLTVPGPPGLPALILPDRLLSPSLRLVACSRRLVPAKCHHLPLPLFFLQSVSGCGTLAFVRPHFEPPSHILCSFSHFYIFFFLSQHIWTFGLDKCIVCPVSHSHMHTQCVFFLAICVELGRLFFLDWVMTPATC